MNQKTIVQQSIKSNFCNLSEGAPISYVLIDKRLLKVGDHINFSLFFNDALTHMSLFLQSDTVIDEEHRRKLKEIERLYVHQNEKSVYETFVEEELQRTVEDASLSLNEKVDIIYSSTSQLTDSLYKNPDALENVQRSKKIIEPIIETIFHNEKTIKSFIKIIGYDYYTHTHSLNVSIYALCLGSEMGLNEKKLNDLGCAALLHDLGKSGIEHNIINKHGALSQDEFEKMKKHPSLGYEIALNIGIKNKDILDGIRHHHEKLDGNGYPDGLKDKEITLFPRIIGVCDVFDALTTKRSYKAAIHSYDAIYIMKTRMPKHLDINIIDTFIKMLHD
ncbi:HD-GYP domain-containing protein [Sulfurimonas sp. RIFOXYB12_FULL_35_9]|uniref:HD-GYP domain-containing protein n=1 Tax=Sulfurimonas sp. RIFOXYB12_FULL_35_9 TaxID=1802256 RepID=UPI0025EAE0EB|nr:HD-GYP domain-containing protein [Sulfurimonas sp. RIFOXYB12_FULL_35_9]